MVSEKNIAEKIQGTGITFGGKIPSGIFGKILTGALESKESPPFLIKALKPSRAANILSSSG